ncbi:MAG: AbrB/MazE/SpoVT family DNA-binding domain-containing protein [Candidatus Natronoplasma sp.]
MGKNKLDSRGRITIPKWIRDDFHLEPGEEVEVREEGDRIVIEPKKPVVKKARSEKEWDESAFLDAGEATFGSEE